MRTTKWECFLKALLAILLAGSTAIAQEANIWTVVRYPADETVQVTLVSPSSPGGGGKADVVGPVGRLQVLRDESKTSVSVDVRGLRDGTHAIYAIDAQANATKLGVFSGPMHKETYDLPLNFDKFMVIVSRNAGLRSLPEDAQIELYSATPKGLSKVPR